MEIYCGDFFFCFVLLVFLPSGFFLSHTIGTQNLAMVMPSLCSLLPSLDGAVWSHDLSWLASWISTVFVVVVAAIVVVVVCATAAVVLSPWTEKIIMFVQNQKKTGFWFTLIGLLLTQLKWFFKLSAAVFLLPWTKKWDNFL